MDYPEGVVIDIIDDRLSNKKCFAGRKSEKESFFLGSLPGLRGKKRKI